VLGSGGGAPTIYRESVEELFFNDDNETCKGFLLLIPVVLGVGKVSATSDYHDNDWCLMDCLITVACPMMHR
jgi:hypothetical protein